MGWVALLIVYSKITYPKQDSRLQACSQDFEKGGHQGPYALPRGIFCTTEYVPCHPSYKGQLRRCGITTGHAHSQ